MMEPAALQHGERRRYVAYRIDKTLSTNYKMAKLAIAFLPCEGDLKFRFQTTCSNVGL
jgi:hypothetical protein